MGLDEWADRKVDTLSKGMQQKIQLASTFQFDPDLVILDEPFSGLDPLNVEMLRDIIREQNQRGCTIIFSTHMLAEAEKLCDFICLIDGGEVIVDGSMDEVRGQFPMDSVRVAFADDTTPATDLDGVEEVTREEGSWRLRLGSGVDPQVVLTALQQKGPLSLFTAHRPTLDEIFLTAVRRRRGEGAAVEVSS